MCSGSLSFSICMNMSTKSSLLTANSSTSVLHVTVALLRAPCIRASSCNEVFGEILFSNGGFRVSISEYQVVISNFVFKLSFGSKNFKFRVDKFRFLAFDFSSLKPKISRIDFKTLSSTQIRIFKLINTQNIRIKTEFYLETGTLNS